MADHFASVFLSFSFFLVAVVISDNISPEEKKALVLFKQSVTHNPDNGYDWNELKPICNSKSAEEDANWKGVGCDDSDTTIIDIKIPGAIGGVISKETIGKLENLEVLNLRENQLISPLPDDISNLVRLTHLRLNNNNFSGPIPDYFSKLDNLTHILLNDNKFSGSIPHYFANLKLEEFDVSNNNFSGEIPHSLSKFKNAFKGNKYLCGPPLPPCKNRNRTRSIDPPSPQPAESQAADTTNENKEKGLIVGVSVSSGLLLLMLLCCLGKKKFAQPPPNASRAPAAEVERKKFVFLENEARENYSFDYMEDLYQASQVVLGDGSSTVGASIKMLIDGGQTVVVKRLTVDHSAVTKEEFEKTMKDLGKMKHENVVPLIAYYYSEDKKLLVYPYMPAGSLFARLHGWQDFGQRRLNWDHRMRIALCAARGVEYLHIAKVVHGNIKSFNILLRQETNKYVASVSNYGMGALFGRLTSQNNYQAPQEVTFESDVYSFGVLLFELLSGINPNKDPSDNEQIKFPMWVQSVTHGKPSAEVFDEELRSQNIEELVQLLEIAKDCVLTEPGRRPIMQKVVSMMEDMNKVERDDWLRLSSDDHSRAFDDTPSTETRDTPSTITP